MKWVGRCKPDFVPATLLPQVAVISLTDALRNPSPACAVERLIPEVINPAGAGLAARAGRFLCSVLHRVGFILPPSLQSER